MHLASLGFFWSPEIFVCLVDFFFLQLFRMHYSFNIMQNVDTLQIQEADIGF